MFKNKKSSSYPRSKQEENIEEDDSLYHEISNLKINENLNSCNHEDTIFEDNIQICVNCGLKLCEEFNLNPEWRFYGENDNKNASDPNRCQYRKIPDKGIRKDLENLNIPSNVIEIADILYNDITKGDIKRSNLRKGIIFACVFQAYKILNKPQTPDVLQTKFNINRKNMSKGLTYFWLRSENKNKEYITAEHFIPKICEKFNIKDNHIKCLLELYKKIADKSSILNRSNPQSVSSALVYYYLKKLNVDISASTFGESVNLSEVTILNKANEIDEVLNNELINDLNNC
jgi:transcription initiation factor TFIIIB Brf1 subunit/transcription initiation factor TFIIB